MDRKVTKYAQAHRKGQPEIIRRLDRIGADRPDNRKPVSKCVGPDLSNDASMVQHTPLMPCGLSPQVCHGVRQRASTQTAFLTSASVAMQPNRWGWFDSAPMVEIDSFLRGHLPAHHSFKHALNRGLGPRTGPGLLKHASPPLSPFAGNRKVVPNCLNKVS